MHIYTIYLHVCKYSHTHIILVYKAGNIEKLPNLLENYCEIIFIYKNDCYNTYVCMYLLHKNFILGIAFFDFDCIGFEASVLCCIQHSHFFLIVAYILLKLI